MFPPNYIPLAFLALAPLAHTTPTNVRAKRDVFVPPVTYPHNGTVWQVHSFHNVTWDTSNAPVNITNSVGRIQLRKGDATLPLILADGFDVRLGRIEVQTPWVTPDTDYCIVFFGDSGDFSDVFTITD